MTSTYVQPAFHMAIHFSLLPLIPFIAPIVQVALYILLYTYVRREEF